MNTPETNLVVERHALEELNAAFNEIAARHGLDATNAALVSMNFCANLLATQFVRGESRKDYRRKCGETMDHLLRFYLPRIEQ